MKLKSPSVGSVPEDQMSFTEWAKAKYHEVKQQIRYIDEATGKVDPQELNAVLAKFSSNFAWAITMQEIELKKARDLEAAFTAKRKRCWTKARTRCKEESAGEREPTIGNIEAKIESMFGDELNEMESAVIEQKSRGDLLRGIVKVLDKHANVLQTLSSNMRSEMFYSGGVPIAQGGAASVRGSVASAKDELAGMGSRPVGQEPAER